MNNKYIIANSLTFSKNNLESASKLLNQEINESVLPANGEIKELSKLVNEIISQANHFKKLLRGVKVIDDQRRELVESVNETKDD